MKNKITIYLSFIFAFSACLILSPSITNAKNLTSIDLIEAAYRSGHITYRDALNYKVSAVIRPDSLPEEFKSKLPIKSATPIMQEARSNKELLSPEIATILARERNSVLTALYSNNKPGQVTLSRDLKDNGVPLYENGITLHSIVSTARHFRIHYTIDSNSPDAVPLTDSDNNDIPDYVEKFADILDNIWQKEVEEMGFNAPPSDGTEGGDCLLDVYLADLGAYGYTQIDTSMPASSVYLIMENDYAGFPSSQADSMKVTAAHEFFHTIQFQISDNINLYGWWMEASATWMEDQIYPAANDYINYLDRWFQNPEIPLYTYESDVFQYGTSVWIKHMTEKYGSKFVYDVWDNIKNGDSAITGIEKVLSDNNSSLEEELKELRAANLTYTYDDGQIYKSWSIINPVAVLFNPIPRFYLSDPPQTLFENFSGTQENINGSLVPLSARYYKFTAPAGSGALKIDFDGDGDISVMVVGFKSYDTVYDVTELLTDPSTNAGSISIKGFSSSGPYTEVVVIPLTYTNTTSASNQRVYSMTASYTTASYNASSILIKPAVASIVTENTGYGKKGKQQYYVIMYDNNNQILESGFQWSSAYAYIDSNGFLTASDAVTSTITASLGNLVSTAYVSGNNPLIMTPGASRNCDTSNLVNKTNGNTINTNNSSGSNDKRCFIATAAFGSPLHPYVNILREFRDRYLLTNYPGRYFVSFYYYYSPSIAKTIEEYTILKSIVKISLIPAIMFSSFMVKTTLAGKIVVGILLSALFFIFITKVFNPKLTLKNAQVQGRTRI